MKFNHVQQRNARFLWRLNILGETLRNLDSQDREITYSHPALAAYDCDLVKHFIRERFHLHSSKTEPSFPPEVFQERAAQNNLDLSDLDAVYQALPETAREFLSNVGPELQLHADRIAASAKATGTSDYLVTLLGALPSRLNDGLTVLRKARQLSILSDEKKCALLALDTKISEFEVECRNEVARILTLP